MSVSVAMTCGCVIFLLFGSRMLRFDDITMNLMFWRSDYNEICATKGLKKENDPANSQIFWHLEMLFFGGVVGRSSSCCQDARTDTLEATRFTELMVMERESDTSTDRWKQREGP